ncbi:hypothetical protein, partial [Nitrospira sp. BLG_2]|uniref:hypothetical protein n=1 Tax=Nitrospira sp. BLG_2 TaxID=3397507 RepID=UPI003B9D2BEF
MNESSQKTAAMPRLKGIHRKAISLSQEHLVTAEPLFPGKMLPLLVQPTVTGLSLVGWVEQQREWVQ